MNVFSKLISDFDDALFPGFRCYVCGREVENCEMHLCNNCRKIFPFITGDICIKCGMPIRTYNTYCDTCKEFKYYFDEARASFLYDDVSHILIHRLKYGGAKYIAEYFGVLLADVYKNWGIHVDMIIPVPLHEKRLKARGYNQSTLIAESLSKLIGVEVREDIIRRKVNTSTQTALTREERSKNLKDVFEFISNEKLSGKNILILDDVFTTGATTNEIAKMLRKHKPNKIYVISAGKTKYFNE